MVGSCEEKINFKINDIYMKIARMASGNVIQQIHNNGLTFQLFFSFFLLEKIQQKQVINITTTYVGKATVTLDVANVSSNL